MCIFVRVSFVLSKRTYVGHYKPFKWHMNEQLPCFLYLVLGRVSHEGWQPLKRKQPIFLQPFNPMNFCCWKHWLAMWSCIMPVSPRARPSCMALHSQCTLYSCCWICTFNAHWHKCLLNECILSPLIPNWWLFIFTGFLCACEAAENSFTNLFLCLRENCKVTKRSGIAF